MKLSVIIPTRNEARNIRPCLAPLLPFAVQGHLEVIVVDNSSPDGTADLAAATGVRVVTQGPERSAQRNRGALREASGDFVMFVDADMRVSAPLMDEILGAVSSPDAPDALYVREEIGGQGLWSRVRRFERSFYDGTCIDGLRVFRRELLKEIGGFDESLYAAEDWDLDRRLLARTSRVSITKQALLHDEGDVSLRQYLSKKSYYARNLNHYIAKWGNDSICRRQFGLRYRMLTVFLEDGKWRRSLAHPHLLLAVWLTKVLVGMVFWVRKRESA